MFFVILLYALFGSVFTISKTGLQYADPFFFVGIRMVVAGIILLAYQFIVDRSKFSIGKKDGIRICLLAFFSIFLTNTLEFWSLKYLTSFKTCFLYSLSPFLSALFSYFLFTERLNMKKWFGLLIGFAGFIPILMNQTTAEESLGHLFFLSWPVIAMLGATISSVYGWILLKQLVSEHHYSPTMANGMSMLLGGMMALIQSLFTENWDPIPVLSYLPFLECTLLLIVISNLICYNLYGALLKRFSATFISFAGFTTPLFTALFGWLFLGEVVTLPFYLSTVVVFVGLIMFYQEELKGEFVDPDKQKLELG